MILNFNVKENSRPLIFLICLAISTVLWLISSLGKTYETSVSMPVRYSNLPENKVLINYPPSRLQVTIEASGFTLLRHKFRISVNPINFNIASLANNYLGNPKALKLVTRNYIARLSNQLSSEISIIDISPDTLFFQLDELETKEVRINPNVSISFENQYFLYDSIKFNPERITVKGPKSIIDTLNSVFTKHKKYKNLNTTIKRNIAIEPVGQVEMIQKKVQMEIPVSQYTEYNEKISLSKINVPDSANLVTFPGLVNVSCLVSVHHYKNISTSSFILCVDYNDVNHESKLLPVKAVSKPPFIKNFAVYPTEVEYFIERKLDD